MAMKVQARAAVLSAFPVFFSRRLPPLLSRTGQAAAAALYTFPSSSSPSAAGARGFSSQTPAAAPPQAPITTTASICTPETVRGRHLFKVAGYSLLKGLGVGKFVRSATFAVGGYDWCVRYCPDGDRGEESHGDGDGDCAAVFLALLTKDAEVRALFDFRLLNPATGGVSPSIGSGMERLTVFNDAVWSWGYKMSEKRSHLESSKYVHGDCLVIQCDVTVIMGTPVSQCEATLCEIQAPACDIHVPPSVLLDNLWNLVDGVNTADVTFEVKGQFFRAHRSVLAMRAPVFVECVAAGGFDMDTSRTTMIGHIEPDVFNALLEYIYTDSLPAMDDLEGGNTRKMVEGLLDIADTYAIDRLKLMCESVLCKTLSVNNVAATLDIAKFHHCRQLRDACFLFITSSGRMDDVVASEGYRRLKVTCPSLVAEIWEKAGKSPKNQLAELERVSGYF